jgi:hypothetical protein
MEITIVFIGYCNKCGLLEKLTIPFSLRDRKPISSYYDETMRKFKSHQSNGSICFNEHEYTDVCEPLTRTKNTHIYAYSMDFNENYKKPPIKKKNAVVKVFG